MGDINEGRDQLGQEGAKRRRTSPDKIGKRKGRGPLLEENREPLAQKPEKSPAKHGRGNQESLPLREKKAGGSGPPMASRKGHAPTAGKE